MQIKEGTRIIKGSEKIFNPQKEFDNIITWTRNWFIDNAPNKPVIVGMSGGKDSTITAGLLCAALGKENVLGVILPNGNQKDLDIAIDVCKHMDINHLVININDITKSIEENIEKHFILVDATKYNIPPRVRMTYLYAVAASVDGVVANTSNYSEAFIKYETKWGDMCGDFSLLADYTVSEVLQIGKILVSLGICKEEHIYKTPEDGLTGKTDEDVFGFTYEELDIYIMYDISPSMEKLTKIKSMYKKGLHKSQCISLPYPRNRGAWRCGRWLNDSGWLI